MNRKILVDAIIDSFRKLHPAQVIANPVMALVYLGAVITTISTVTRFSGFNFQIAFWLWFTVIFANFAESVAEGRGKAQARALRGMRVNVKAKRLAARGHEVVDQAELKVDDRIICEAGDVIPADGEVIEGIASVDESAMTGESAPVIRESGGDRSAVTGGTKVISDRVIIRVTNAPGAGFLDRMIQLIESAKRRKTPNEIALGIMLVSLTVVFVVAVLTLPAFVVFLQKQGAGQTPLLTLPVLIALIVCLIPTTIAGLLSAIGISGMDRLIKRNIIATSGRSVEAAGDVNVLLLDKTGTITLGNRMASNFFPAPGVTEQELAESAQLSSLADETPEGRSIVVLAKQRFNLRHVPGAAAKFIPFTAQTRTSGVEIADRRILKGAVEAILALAKAEGISVSPDTVKKSDEIARKGGTPLAVVDRGRFMGLIELKDVVKGGIRERFAQLRAMGIRTVMITGDNPLTAAAIAAEAGVDDFIAQATPEDKLNYIRSQQAQGRMVAMTGDGTNDAPALAQADVGVAMHTGTQAAREAGNMIDLDSNPTKLIEVVEIGKQLLITRGALTTFSVSNDVAKYFAILPSTFGLLYVTSDGRGLFDSLNIMRLHSPESAVLSALIFNALIIMALIPLALRGVRYRPLGADELLTRNLLIYGLGGLVVPFAGIKIIDVIITALKWV